jgi:hypothetical protein
MEENKSKYDYLGRKLSWSGFDFDEEILDEDKDD